METSERRQKMTEDYATIKQIEFMKKLGFPPQSAALTKAEARVMIDRKLTEDRNGEAPVEKTATVSFEAKTNGGAWDKPYKECHLSPEEVRCRALEAAIEWSGDKAEMETVMIIANQFVEWIYGK